MPLPQAQPNKPLYARRNPDGTVTYYQTTTVPSATTIPLNSAPVRKTMIPQAQVSPTPVQVAKKQARAGTVSETLVFYVNGKKQIVYDIDPRMTLNEYLRSSYGLSGTKKMCGEV